MPRNTPSIPNLARLKEHQTISLASLADELLSIAVPNPPPNTSRTIPTAHHA